MYIRCIYIIFICYIFLYFTSILIVNFEYDIYKIFCMIILIQNHLNTCYLTLFGFKLCSFCSKVNFERILFCFCIHFLLMKFCFCSLCYSFSRSVSSKSLSFLTLINYDCIVLHVLAVASNSYTCTKGCC